MLSEYTVGQRVERPSGDTRAPFIRQSCGPLKHLSGCLPRKCQKENGFRRHSRLHQTGDSIDQRPGFPASCPGYNQDRPLQGHDRLKLCGVQNLFIGYVI